MRKVGTILSPECKVYASDIEKITGVDEYINLQYLRLIENLICQRICEQMLDNKRLDVTNKPIVVELPLVGNLTIIPYDSETSSVKQFNFQFEPLSTFKKHIQNIYSTNSCNLISLLSENYANELVKTYKNVLGDI